LAITQMAISPNGRTLATAGWDPTIRLWDVATAKERRLEGHRGTVTSLAWSADGKTLVSGNNDGTALVWDVTK
jgi:WD40 repeat protein